jgi:vacuolar-type H+-ATPase subunit F/Vma7
MDIVAIGNGDFTLGLRLVNVRVTEVPDPDIERELTRALGDPAVGIIIISEKGAATLGQAARLAATKSIKPVVVTLSGREDQALRDRIRSVIGVDLVARPGGG